MTIVSVPDRPDRRVGPQSNTPSVDSISDDGEMGSLIWAADWSETPIGPIEGWSLSLRTIVSFMLASRFPLLLWWGPDYISIYNDPYRSVLGAKHPWALGKPVRECWSEIWDILKPLIDAPFHGGPATWIEDLPLEINRYGFVEETHFTVAYSPVPDESAPKGIGGVMATVHEITEKIVGERRITALRDLGAHSGEAKSAEEACSIAMAALGNHPKDVPFAIAYLFDGSQERAWLASATGVAPGESAAPLSLDSTPGADVPWPVSELLRRRSIVTVENLAERFSALLPGPWPDPPHTALVVPIKSNVADQLAGFLVAGVSPRLGLDEHYRSFFDLVASQIATAIATARAYEEERKRAEVLSEIDRAKTLFFSNVSHEFRTPLTLMLGPLEDALASADLPMGERERLDVAHRNSLRLLKLVNSLLDFSRIEGGRAQVSCEAVDLAAFTTELAGNFRSACERAGLQLIVDCSSLPQPVYVDRDMWEKIVLNLLSNAFKFTFEGEIAVELRCSADQRSAELTVRDSGVGVPQSELPRLFERFHRIEGQRSRSFEGSGIGLALVQELVKLHGGVIHVESELGKGTAFTVSIPLETVHLPAAHIHRQPSRLSTSLRAEAYVEEALKWLPQTGEPGEAHGDRADDAPELLFRGRTNGARILVVDDNADMRNYIRRLLGSRWQVETVSDGQDALEAIRTRKPDLVLTDVMMPRLDGFGLLHQLRSEHDLRDLPVIVLSARAGEEARVEGLDAGADDYLTKPFSARELIARVNANLEMSRLRSEASRELRESEARFRNMAENAPVMMWMTDQTGALTYLNRLWSEFTGQSHEAALGFGAWEALHPEDRDKSERIFFAANAAREPFRIECRLRRSDGTYRWALSAAGPRFGDDNEFHGYIGSVIDITDRKEVEQILRQANEMLEQRVATVVAERAEAEAQLRQAQKMEAVGKLTGGVAHDFNNVLQVIGGNLQLLSRDVAGNLRAEQRLQTAIAAISRGSKLASQLLAFGRRQPLAPKVINLGRLIRSIDDMVRRALGDGVETDTIISDGLWNTFVDAVQVENALLNLAINARDAMEGHGKLKIEAENTFLDDDYAARHADVATGQYVMLAVTDTGCGIPPDIIERVFEPFFTTKPQGQGTGLGLSMVYGFVKQSGGHINIYSEPRQGTTVRIYLPRTREAEDVETNIETGPATGGTETVLVVEDDEQVRGTVVDMLSELGYRVLRAEDTQNALAIIEGGIPIDLLFTDVVMPGPLRSFELAQRAQERLPNIAVLFTSGYTENAIVHAGRLDRGIELLSKPYTREALARKIRYVLRSYQRRSIARPLSHESQRAASHILVIDDDRDLCFVMEEMLRAEGYKVSVANDGEQGIKLQRKQPASLLITDIFMPNKEGVETIRDFRREFPDVPIIAMSGGGRLKTHGGLLIAKELGAAEILRKPFEMNDLLRSVAAALNRLEP
jgi:PAS domain S-box-containing protein